MSLVCKLYALELKALVGSLFSLNSSIQIIQTFVTNDINCMYSQVDPAMDVANKFKFL